MMEEKMEDTVISPTTFRTHLSEGTDGRKKTAAVRIHRNH